MLLTITSAQLLLVPCVVDDGRGGVLKFRPSVEKMDMKNIPEFVDSGIAGIVNRRLAAEGDKLSWHFGKTLKSHFPVGKDLVEIDAFDLSASDGQVKVLSDAIVFTLDFTMVFVRRAE